MTSTTFASTDCSPATQTNPVCLPPLLRSNYRMKLTPLGHRFAWRTASRPRSGGLAEARLGLQLMRGR